MSLKTETGWLLLTRLPLSVSVKREKSPLTNFNQIYMFWSSSKSLRAVFNNKTMHFIKIDSDDLRHQIYHLISPSEMEGTFIKSEGIASRILGILRVEGEIKADHTLSAKTVTTRCSSILIQSLLDLVSVTI
jgi:hypothetical protein